VDNAFLDLPEPFEQPWCLQFTNTVGERKGPGRSERFSSSDDLKSWLQAKGILHPEAATPVEDPRSVERALRLREAIYGIASAIARHGQPDENDLSELNWNVQRAVVGAKLEPGNQSLAWNTESQRTTIAGCLGLIALSAAGLFTGIRADRIRECGNETCGWLFLDLSKNRSRKWCDMSDCGNRAKARRYYSKKRSEKAIQPAGS